MLFAFFRSNASASTSFVLSAAISASRSFFCARRSSASSFACQANQQYVLHGRQPDVTFTFFFAPICFCNALTALRFWSDSNWTERACVGLSLVILCLRFNGELTCCPSTIQSQGLVYEFWRRIAFLLRLADDFWVAALVFLEVDEVDTLEIRLVAVHIEVPERD
jgi:hypothetical protein